MCCVRYLFLGLCVVIGCGVGVERLSVPICQCGYCVNICVCACSCVFLCDLLWMCVDGCASIVLDVC